MRLLPALLALLVTPLATSAAPATQGAAGAMSLEEALKYAAEHSPTLDTARRTREIRALERRNALAKFFPSVDVTATQGLRNQAPLAYTTPYTSQLTASATENLYDNGESFLRYSQARLREDLAEVTWQRARDQLALDVSLTFHQLSLSSRLAEVRRQQLELLKKQFASVQTQYHEGMRTRRDFLRFKTQVQRAEIEVVTAQNTLRRAVVELKRLLGWDDDAAGGADPEFRPLEAHIEKAVTLPESAPPLERHFESRIARITNEANEVDVKLARRKWLPNAFVTGSLSYADSDYLRVGELPRTTTTSWAITLGLSYNVWDWGSLRRNVAIADENRSNAANTLRASVQTARAQIAATMLDFERLRENYDLSRELLGYEEETYAFLNSEYKLGRVQYLDLINSVNDLLDAKIRAATAYFGVLDALATYHYQEGKLYESIISR